MLTQKSKFYVAKSKDLADGQWKFNFKNELIYFVHPSAASGLRSEEAKL